MKLLMENWRKYLNEAVSPGDAAMIAGEVLQKVINKEPFYPYPKKEVLGNDTLETFLRREAAQSRVRASDVFDMIEFFQKGYPEDEGAVKSELDALQVLLQLALKGKTHEEWLKGKKQEKEKYYPEKPRPKQIQKTTKMSQQRVTPEPPELSGDTHVFIQKESIISENQNISEKEKTVLKAEALAAFLSSMANPNMAKQAKHEPMRGSDIKKLSDDKLKKYIKIHNHMIDDTELFNFIRGK